MRKELFFITFCLLGFFYSNANDEIIDPGNGKKDELTGLVINADTKKPIKEVMVTAYLVTKKEKVEVTGAEGDFSFDELRPGTYKFVFEKAGFKKVTKDKIVIKTDEAFQMNIEMIENSDYDIMPSPLQLFGL
ncbi:MAG: carboxypeptidase-like regulatory domain-containing protein [Chitinophagaceae bacterium]